MCAFIKSLLNFFTTKLTRSTPGGRPGSGLLHGNNGAGRCHWNHPCNHHPPGGCRPGKGIGIDIGIDIGISIGNIVTGIILVRKGNRKSTCIKQKWPVSVLGYMLPSTLELLAKKRSIFYWLVSISVLVALVALQTSTNKTSWFSQSREGGWEDIKLECDIILA